MLKGRVSLIPLLLQRELRATFFVTAGWIGDQHPYAESRHLTWDDIAGIEQYTDVKGQQMFDVGSHSMWHTTLCREPRESQLMYRQRLEEEIVRASDLIQKRTRLPVRTYAPPKGKGSLTALRTMFELAGIEAVRWASLPGKKNEYHTDLFDLQISYCDTIDQPFDKLAVLLSNRHLDFVRKPIRWLISQLTRISE